MERDKASKDRKTEQGVEIQVSRYSDKYLSKNEKSKETATT